MNAERLADLRHENPKMRQADVASVLGIGTSTYSMYEQGLREPDDEIKVKIARFFNVSVDYLVGTTDLPTAHATRSVDTELNGLRHLLRDETARAQYHDAALNATTRKALAALIDGVLAAADALVVVDHEQPCPETAQKTTDD